MYKCSECGTEYETAPKYCDCGNDIFIAVEDIEPQEIDDDLSDEDIELETKRQRNFRKKSFSTVSVSIFALCIILSLLILFVFGNPKKNIAENIVKNNLSEKIQIPEIDSFWDNTTIKKTETEEPFEKQDENDDIMNIMPKIVQQIMPIQKPEIKADVTIKKSPVKTEEKIKTKPITTQNPPIQKNTPIGQTKTPAQKTSTPTNTSTVMTFEDLTNKIRNQYPTNQTQNSNTKTVQTQATTQKTVNNTAQSTSPKTTPVQTTTPSSAPAQMHTSTQQNNAPVVPTKSVTQLRQELLAYKSNLRNAIGKKIDFTRVIGDGECSLTFKINSNGRLYSKAFLKQSSNITLNDAAFNALNTTTTYNPPPENYNGESLKLTIKFYNGNFEISLN